MPIYDYRCLKCGRRASILIRNLSTSAAPHCPSCGAVELRKLVARFAVMKSEESRLDALADPSSLSGVDEDDPRSIARWARRMGKEVGEELGPEFDEMVDRMEAGEMPDDELAGPNDFGGDGLD